MSRLPLCGRFVAAIMPPADVTAMKDLGADAVDATGVASLEILQARDKCLDTVEQNG